MSLRRGVSWRARLRLKVFCVFIVSAFCVLGFMQKESLAVPFVSGPGDNGLGSFSGDISFNVLDALTSELVVELTNTTVAGGGFLTAFAFNNPGGITDVSLGSTSTTFNTLLGGTNFNDNSIDASPFGDFDIGVGVGTNWKSQGTASDGIAVNFKETFTFTFVGGVGLGLQDFLDELSVGTNPDHDPGFFAAARFKSIALGEGSDKVPGIPSIIPPEPTLPQVPEPATVALLGIGLVGLAGAEARRRRKKKVVDKS